ncbi:MAG: DoxX family membrane protein [Parachlamydiales bacterium]|nr:DoxX family membrane protein [Parachlamydiales bacterium]
MQIIRIIFAAIARFLISLVFLAGALNKILHWHETERNLHSVLCEWQSNLGFSDNAYDCFAFLIPITPVLLLVGLLMELFGSLSILLGFKEKLGAWLLVLFLIPTTIIMHQFWFVDGAMREQQLAHFLKNMAILGGLIVVLLQGIEQKSKSAFPKF